MNVRRTTGYALLPVLGLLSGLGIPFATLHFYDAAVNQDGGWNIDLMAAGAVTVLLWGVVSVLALAVFACLPSRRSADLLYRLSLAAFLLPLLGMATGEFGRWWQFRQNRRHADEVLAALKEYREDHGTYPDRLGDLRRPVTTTLHRGRHRHPLEYRGYGAEGFVLRYFYGWYAYTYDSETAEWVASDESGF